LPDIEPPVVSVQVDYPGASAAVVESRITQVLEDAVAGIEGVDLIESSSRNGRSDVSLEFTLSRDIESAANDVRDAVSRVIDRLPEEADPPQVAKVSADAEPIMFLFVASAERDILGLTDYAERYLLDRFSSISGVASARLGGGQRIDDIDGTGKQRRAALEASGMRQGDRQMRLADTDTAEQDHVALLWQDKSISLAFVPSGAVTYTEIRPLPT
jgi:hypothetical protein